MKTIAQLIADELKIDPKQSQAAVALLDEGATVPFIARYRKEATGGLDDQQLRALEQRLGYLRELEARREVIERSIQEQGKLTEALAQQIAQAQTKQALEDIYLPYKPKRRTKAQIAIEAGIAPVAEAVIADPTLSPEAIAEDYVNAEAGFGSIDKVLEGARDILVEQWSEQSALLQQLREYLWQHAVLVAQQVETETPIKGADKFKDYFDYAEPIAKVPSHRALAIFRGRQEGVLSAKLALSADEQEAEVRQSVVEQMIAKSIPWSHQGRAADDWIQKVIRWAWRIKLSLGLERDSFARLREQAEADAIKVFGTNIKDLLLAAPAGHKVVMGLDPGIRTGVKVAVVDATGKLVDTATIYPHEPRNDWQGALATLAKLQAQHGVEIIAIGNGTASRETDKLAGELIKAQSNQKHVDKVIISEAGASVYSASEYAAAEMPDIDVSLRGAVSIARRLQDPLAELVKIEPKSIGVGQYQHDVNQAALARELDAIIEDCVNAVGVDLNTASAPLLNRVSGLSRSHAHNIVQHREANGPFRNREALLQVAGIGPKAYEQSAGFLRITNGDNPLDQSAVHPESYAIVNALLERAQRSVDAILGKANEVKALRAYTDALDEDVGEYTLDDIFAELSKPGRDPRPEFVMAKLADGVETIHDLSPEMVLEGTVTNVANFGAFVDIGVHQDGLVHISELADRFVKSPADVVKTGDVVKVRVLEIEPDRKRIALSMRSQSSQERQSGASSAAKKSSAPTTTKAASRAKGQKTKRHKANPNSAVKNTAMADALANLKRN